MNYNIVEKTLNFFWTALKEAPGQTRFSVADQLFNNIMEKRWAFNYEVEDLIDCLDTRLSSYEFNVKEVSESFNIQWEAICHRPKSRSIGVTQHEALRIENLVLFLIILERIGLSTYASRFVEKLLPGIKSKEKKLFSNAEIEIFWYNKTQHRYHPITLKISDAAPWPEIINEIKTPTGYTIHLKGDADGRPTTLTVSSPKYRDRPDPVRTICPDCEYEWFKGDPESSGRHRKEHKIRMYYLHPETLPSFIQEMSVSEEPELVTASSPRWKHHEMYIRAKAFRREFSFDFVQWKSPIDNDPNVHGFLFSNAAGAIVGACAFRERTGNDGTKQWGLQWVWICPKERRNGHLSSRWKMFRERFGNFIVESPVSHAMQGFLQKHGDSSLAR